MDSINFVRERRRKLSKVEVQDRVWLRWSMIATGVVAVVVLVIVGVGFFFRWQVSQVQAQQASLKKEVASQVEVERSYVIFANKLRMIKDIVEDRADKQAAIAYFTQAFGSDGLLREINFAADKRIVDFRVQAPDVFAFQRVLQLLDSPAVRERYPKIKREELRRTGLGTYEIGVSIDLGPDKSASPAAGGASPAAKR